MRGTEEEKQIESPVEGVHLQSEILLTQAGGGTEKAGFTAF